ncbi:hypothetical protein ACFWP5_16465 [Streptomyces sp. NPDC058469]|uniref:hypothetical protein n=1 Tax=Streptomyces sp. NPDC058469 TaxID=3346514 RepID=UPI00365BBCA0
MTLLANACQTDFDKDRSKDHSTMATYRRSSGVPYLTYHDTESCRRSLSNLIAVYPNSAHYAYRT